jgi:hypothetical protein
MKDPNIVTKWGPFFLFYESNRTSRVLLASLVSDNDAAAPEPRKPVDEEDIFLFCESNRTNRVLLASLVSDNDAAAPEPPKPVDEEDIFGDAGTEYVPEYPAKGRDRAGDGAGRTERPESYFGSRDDMQDLPALPAGARVTVRR